MLCLISQSWLTLCYHKDCYHQTPLSRGMLQARILEWIAMPSSRESSQSRDWTHVSHITGVFFTIWATRKDRILELIVHPFSRGSSWLRNGTRVFWIEGGFFTSWATHIMLICLINLNQKSSMKYEKIEFNNISPKIIH